MVVEQSQLSDLPWMGFENPISQFEPIPGSEDDCQWALEAFSDAKSFMKALEAMKVISCLKWHEDIPNGANSVVCGTKNTNLACGHFHIGNNARILKAAIGFAVQIGLLSDETARTHYSTLQSATIGLNSVDGEATYIYLNGLADKANLQKIAVQELRFGNQRRKIRDELLALLSN